MDEWEDVACCRLLETPDQQKSKFTEVSTLICKCLDGLTFDDAMCALDHTKRMLHNIVIDPSNIRGIDAELLAKIKGGD